LIDEYSDGVKAFVGMMIEIIAGNPEILLIDEPEAFLHQSLQFQLGQEMARVTAGSRKRLFVSTHSPHFVMGCVQAGVPITLVRLTYSASQATARTLPNEALLRLMRNPLLRSTGVLGGLFYESVIVTEADSDRAFYDEINERLIRAGRGIRNCLFLNAQNKQTIPRIVEPLRNLGIPAAGIVDIDILKNHGAEWTTLVKSIGLPVPEHQATSNQRNAAEARFKSLGVEMKRVGIEALPSPDRESVDNLFRRLAEYGLFVVRGGELESWLKHLVATGHGPAWLEQIFEKMGEDNTRQDYVQPGADDVWRFMDDIGDWLRDPKRRGIPT
jgi:hypothetical protein